MVNFWQTIGKPMMALAPMDDVTDTVFREVILSVSDPKRLHVLFTEFTSTEGICHPKGSVKAMERLFVNDSEKFLLKARGAKLVAQIWGGDPQKFYKTAEIISAMGVFDGIDINMGCPVKKVLRNKTCSALINYPDLAKDIILATMAGSSLPVSVKTRIGVKDIITETWIGQLLETKPQALTIHGRTQKMMSKGIALWDEIEKGVLLRNDVSPLTMILGNGDVCSYDEGVTRMNDFGTDGVMVGTGIFKNPWMFDSTEDVSITQRIELLQFHLNLFERTWGKKKNYNILKRFFKIYLKGFEGAAEWRDLLMQSDGYRHAGDSVMQMNG